jgi:hypothetical protein
LIDRCIAFRDGASAAALWTGKATSRASATQEIDMRVLLLVLGSAIGIAAMGSPAEAQNYPWCAIYNLGEWATNCGFVSEQQCWATVRGIGGYCTLNNTYQPSKPGGYRAR